MTESSDKKLPAVTIAPTPKRRRWLRVLLILVVFLGGMGVGAGVTVIVAVHRLRQAIAHPELVPGQIAGRMQRRLSLSSDQTSQVRSILQERQRRLMAIRRKSRPEVMAEMDRAYDEIRAVLDDKQRVRWERMYEELKTDWLPPMPPEPVSSRPIPAATEP